MSRNSLNKLLVLLAVIVTLPLAAQDLQQDLQQIGRSLDSAKSVVMIAQVNVFSRKGGSKVFQTEASLKRMGKESLTVLADQEFYDNTEYSVTIDHEEQAVSVIKKDEKANKKALKGMNIDVDALAELLREEEGVKTKPVVKLVSNSGGVKTYEITHIPSVKLVRITLNTTQKKLIEITYEYANESEYKGQYIVINYSRFERDTDISGSLKQSAFFTVSGGKIVLSNRLKTYRLYTEL
jgi:hypothetical protein